VLKIGKAASFPSFASGCMVAGDHAAGAQIILLPFLLCLIEQFFKGASFFKAIRQTIKSFI
jgi:hypothetical protein